MLGDETVVRIFLTGFVPDSQSLSLETSNCIRAGFKEIDPKVVMTAGLEDGHATVRTGLGA